MKKVCLLMILTLFLGSGAAYSNGIAKCRKVGKQIHCYDSRNRHVQTRRIQSNGSTRYYDNRNRYIGKKVYRSGSWYYYDNKNRLRR